MSTYNYQNLSPIDFEELSRDIIQKRENIILETFKEGKDKGIDLRYSRNLENTLIVQAKRYKDDFKYLFNTLKKSELNKVKKLNPRRYILITSVGLTPDNKKEIAILFSNFIKDNKDIIGKNDIDNLLELYPEIEAKHFKLWINNTNILKRILHSAVHNQSAFELEEINEVSKYFVQNDSFDIALKIINEYKYVVISGIPGIGKTTLGRMLSLYFLKHNNYEEFVFISESIEEAFELYIKEKRQIFFYNDFLGSNFLDVYLAKNEDSRIISFINRIQADKNKIIIFVTREYILQQAEIKYPILKSISTNLTKSIIDISSYTELIKAKILYNHLYYSELPDEYIKNVLYEENYLKIIEHQYYNPRIINLLTNKKEIWSNIDSSEFTNKFIEYLNDPHLIWKEVYEEKISEMSQNLLLTIAISGTPILEDELILSINNIFHRNNSSISLYNKEFKNCLKELDATFIKTDIDESRQIAIDFQNPSILDFILNYIRQDDVLLTNLISNVSFINQWFHVFEIPKEKEPMLREVKSFKPIIFNSKHIEIIKNVFQSKLKEIGDSTKIYRKILSESSYVWQKHDRNRFYWLNKLVPLYDLETEIDVRRNLIEILNNTEVSELSLNNYFPYYLDLVYRLMPYHKTDILQLIKFFSKKISNFDELSIFTTFAEAFIEQYSEFLVSIEGGRVMKLAEKLIENEFLSLAYSTINTEKTDVISRLFFKAETERICEESNRISEYFGLGIYLDPDYHISLVRSELKRRDEEKKEKNTCKKDEKEKVKQIISEMFKTMNKYK